MASKLRLRYIFRPLVNLTAKCLIRIGVTPNLATSIMLCFSVLSFITLSFFRNLILFSIFVFITGIMDGCDGAIARLTNKVTTFGGFFDSLMDRISEFFIFFGLLIFNYDQLLWSFIDMKLIIFFSFIISIMISYSRARAEVFFKGNFDFGLMARSERLFFIVITALIGIFYDLDKLFLFIFMWLVIGTFLFRVIRIYYLINKKSFQIEEREQ